LGTSAAFCVTENHKYLLIGGEADQMKGRAWILRLREVCVEAYYLDDCLDKEEPGRGTENHQPNFPGRIGLYGN
jgi:hypothetical protein